MRRIFTLLPASALLAACASHVDLQAVQKYAQATADASSSFSSVAEDFNASCLRRRELTLRPRELPTTLIELAPAYTASPLPTPQPAPPAGDFNDARCTGAKAVSEEWDKRNKIVLGYVQALGAIAKVDAKPAFAPLGGALVDAKLISKDQDGAFAKLAEQLSSIVVAGDQRAAIARTVTEADPSLKVAIGALKTVDDDYGQLLNAEFNETFNFYNSLIRSELGPGPTPDSIPPAVRNEIYSQRGLYNASLAAINDRRASTLGYAAVLDGILKTHEALLAAAQRNLGTEDFAAILNEDVLPLYNDVAALRKVTK